MNEDSHPPIFPGDLPRAEAVSALSRLRHSAADSLFQASQFLPKLLKFRTTPSAWTAFRILLGAAGAGLVVLPLSLWNGWAFAPVGLVLFLLAVLLPPLQQGRDSGQAVQQLGAYLVLDGGNFAGDESSPSVNFYLTPTRVWALDQRLRPITVIPADEINAVTALPGQQDWTLRVSWNSGSAEFTYDGLFAERRARLAEDGMRHLVQRAERPAAKAKAASA